VLGTRNADPEILASLAGQLDAVGRIGWDVHDGCLRGRVSVRNGRYGGDNQIALDLVERLHSLRAC
jgi:hypothetical protein